MTDTRSFAPGVVSAASSARLVAVGIVLCIIGVLGRWSEADGIGLNGLQGANNGWLVLLFLPLAGFAAGRGGGGSLRAIIAVGLTAVLTLATLVMREGVAGSSMGWGKFVAGFGALLLLTAAGRAWLERETESVEADSMNDSSGSSGPAEAGLDEPDTDRPPRWRGHVSTAGLVAVVFVFLVLRQIVAVGEKASWPPPPDATTSDEAQEATEVFAERATRPGDVGLDYAWSTASSVEPYVEGVEFFPRIFADIEAAESSIHILMFGWKPGDVGFEMADLIEQKLAAGVEVRVLVDGFGSLPYLGSGDLFDRLVDAGAEIVVNDILPPDGDGRYGDRSLDLRHDEVGRADHRKLYVIDGTVAWTGGAGIEDHFRNGEFHDVMVRVTGDVVRQAQAVFLTSFSSHDAPLPDDLSPYFVEAEDPGTIPIAVLQVVPGGFASAPQSLRELIDSASERLDVMNPYFTDKDMIDRIIRAARRGVEVRVVVSEESNNALATAAFRHRHGELVDAGVEIWEFPAVVHAKVMVADDSVHFGTVNLDAWALYRDFEVAMVAEDGELADRFVAEVFDPDVARSQPGRGPSGLGHVVSWFADKIAYFL